MKTEFHIPPVLIRAPSEEPGVRISGDRIFAPLSVPAIYERRIDLATPPELALPRYRFKRDDEAVN